jgi:hypothetical protein
LHLFHDGAIFRTVMIFCIKLKASSENALVNISGAVSQRNAREVLDGYKVRFDQSLAAFA